MNMSFTEKENPWLHSFYKLCLETHAASVPVTISAALASMPFPKITDFMLWFSTGFN